jgi:uncharacterized protein (TIGR02302 family)
VTDRPPGLPIGPQPQRAAAASALERALLRAWWALLWERLWPPLALAACAIGLFLILSWAGLWFVLPPLARAIALAVLAVVIVAGFVPLARLRRPDPADALSRLDRESGMRHRPATALADPIAAGAQDAGALALWQAHKARALSAASGLKAGLPHPRLMARDPYAIRALVVMLLVASFVFAGGERFKRVASAFDWRGMVAPVNYRIDAWVTPPNYTGRPPVLLPGIRTGEPVKQVGTVSVPVGSVLTIRASGTPLDLTTEGLADGGQADGRADNGNPVPAGTEERRFTVNAAGSVTLRGLGFGRDVTWNFGAIPDRAPTIALTKDPEPQARGSLLLAYKLEDDYGVTQAEAEFARKPPPAKPGAPSPHPLYEAPKITLLLPQSRTRNGVGQTIKDLSDHPWAGSEVAMTLVAHDEAKNEGRSKPYEVRIPQRPFYKPLARALVEQRRDLALDAHARGQVLTALDALTIAPERFIPELNIYLGLRAIYWALADARSDDDLRSVADRLWSMATMIEDGNISDAEAQLRAAQEALRQALERGAPDEEIKRLTDQLRAALDKFMQALAQELRKNPQQLARPLDRNARELRPQDLRSMIDRMEDLARSGNKEAARQLLQQLQSMLENLQMARPGQSGDDNDMMSALDNLGDMIRREQQLRDKTYRQGQDGRRDRQRGQQGDRNGKLGDLQQDQQALRQQLNKLLNEMRKRGQMGQPGQPGQQPGEDDGSGSLGDAEQAMRDAEGALGQGDAEGAVDSQGRAIEAMRRGAQSLAQQMQGPNGEGPNGQPGRVGPARAQQDTDPLGRPLRGHEYGDDATVKVPGEIDAQRARRILEELRRRFGDPKRPQIELDYIDRLLKGFM